MTRLHIRPLAIASLVASLSACTVGPNYQRPAPAGPTPAAFKERAPTSGTWQVARPSDAAFRGPWWQLFADSTLNGLEERIAVSNQSLKAAVAQYQAARALVRVARAAALPTLGAGPAATRAHTSFNQANTVPGVTHYDVSAFTLQAQASWEPDLWGTVRRSVEQAQANVQASEADLANLALSLQAELAMNYFQLRGLDTQTQLLESTLASDLDYLHLTEVRFKGGVATEVDVAQAETQVRSVKAQSIDLGAARAQAEHAIALLIGVPASEFSLPPSPIAAPALPAIPNGVPSTLLERRPDIAAAERRAAAANAQIGIATAAYYPHVTLGATGGLESGVLGTLLSTSSFFWSLGASAVESVFDGGRRRALTEQARQNYEAQAASYRQSVLNAFREVEDGLAATRVMNDEAVAENLAVEAARRSLALSSKRYKGGVATYLEVLTAQTIQLTNERAQAELITRRYAASVQLIRALGGGWEWSKPSVATSPQK